MKIPTASYLEQSQAWPQSGKHILAHFDDASIIVYHAYRPSIGECAARNGYFGGDFKLSHMSWIKPNCLWIMYRSGWATMEGQEVVLAVQICRHAFDLILGEAVVSTYKPHQYADQEAWEEAVAESNVRLQFDPDHDPHGQPVERRAIQLGLRGDVLTRYSREWIVGIEDISDLVREQHQHVLGNDLAKLVAPIETVYPLDDEAVRFRLGLN